MRPRMRARFSSTPSSPSRSSIFPASSGFVEAIKGRPRISCSTPPHGDRIAPRRTLLGLCRRSHTTLRRQAAWIRITFAAIKWREAHRSGRREEMFVPRKEHNKYQTALSFILPSHVESIATRAQKGLPRRIISLGDANYSFSLWTKNYSSICKAVEKLAARSAVMISF